MRWIEQQVSGFNVLVYDMSGMQVMESLESLVNVLVSLPQRKLLLLTVIQHVLRICHL